MEDVKGKIILITGATSGIGVACAEDLADKGATVIISGRNENIGKQIVKNILDKGKKAFFVKVDLENDETILKAKQYIEEQFGKLDVLVNNAGIYPVEGGIEVQDRRQILDIYNTNVVGLMTVTKIMLSLIKNSKGVIINNASIGGMDSFTSGQSYGYACSKAAIIKFSKMLAKKYGGEFRTNCICPGTINTPIFKKFDESRMAMNIPMGRTGRPEEVASVVTFLSSENSSYINGAVITIDGGQSL